MSLDRGSCSCGRATSRLSSHTIACPRQQPPATDGIRPPRRAAAARVARVRVTHREGRRRIKLPQQRRAKVHHALANCRLVAVRVRRSCPTRHLENAIPFHAHGSGPMCLSLLACTHNSDTHAPLADAGRAPARTRPAGTCRPRAWLRASQTAWRHAAIHRTASGRSLSR